MLKRRCKVLFFGVYFAETFVHVAEERANVPYRFWKTLTADYIDEGVSNRISADFFARKLDLFPSLTSTTISWVLLRENGIIFSTSLGGGEVTICEAAIMVDELTERLKETPSYALQPAKIWRLVI
jgi:aminoglycoside N3'-acetyltransferase